MMDINVRRMVWRVFYMEKAMGSRDPSPTMPALCKWGLFNLIHPRRNVIWGIYTLTEFSPVFRNHTPEAVGTLWYDYGIIDVIIFMLYFFVSLFGFALVRLS